MILSLFHYLLVSQPVNWKNQSNQEKQEINQSSKQLISFSLQAHIVTLQLTWTFNNKEEK